MKRWLSILLCLCVAAAVWAGGEAEATATDSEPLVNESGFPIVTRPITLDAVAIQQTWSRDWNDMPLFQAYEEQTGIRVEFTMIPQADRREKVNIMLASGDYPDMSFTPGLNGRTSEMAADGVIVPLNDLIDEWAPQIQAMFEEQPIVKPVCTYPDGNIYSFMRYHNTSHHLRTASQWYINTEWLDTLGLEMPETTDEFYDVLMAFKTGDPNGNGEADEIPLAFWTRGNGEIWEWIRYFGPWGVVDNIMVQDGELRWGFTDPGFKEGLKYYQKLYADGLLDLESISQTMAQVKAKSVVDGVAKIGVSHALAPQFLYTDPEMIFKYEDSFGTLKTMDMLRINDEQIIKILPPLRGPAGHQLWHENVGGGMVAREVAYLYEVNEYPEATTRWMDTWYDGAEMGQSMLIGPIGVRWFIDEDTGHYQNIDPPEGMNKNEHRAQHAPGSGGFAVGYYDRYGKITKPPYPEHMMLEEQTEVYLQYVPEESWPPNFIIPTPEESDFINQYEEEMLGYVWETMARFIFTDADIDNEWPDFVSQLERMRSDEILEIRQEQYDRYLSNF